MIVLAFKYIPFIPPYTPAPEDVSNCNWFDEPLDVFKLPGQQGDAFANKPCHSVFLPYTKKLIGYYCARTDTHVLCLNRFMKALQIRN